MQFSAERVNVVSLIKHLGSYGVLKVRITANEIYNYNGNFILKYSIHWLQEWSIKPFYYYTLVQYRQRYFSLKLASALVWTRLIIYCFE